MSKIINLETALRADQLTAINRQIYLGKRLQRDYPEIVDFCRIMEDNGKTIFRAGDNLYEEENVLFSDESVFRLFTWPLVAGNRMTALTKPFTMVIS